MEFFKKLFSLKKTTVQKQELNVDSTQNNNVSGVKQIHIPEITFQNNSKFFIPQICIDGVNFSPIGTTESIDLIEKAQYAIGQMKQYGTVTDIENDNWVKELRSKISYSAPTNDGGAKLVTPYIREVFERSNLHDDDLTNALLEEYKAPKKWTVIHKGADVRNNPARIMREIEFKPTGDGPTYHLTNFIFKSSPSDFFYYLNIKLYVD